MATPRLALGPLLGADLSCADLRLSADGQMASGSSSLQEYAAGPKNRQLNFSLKLCLKSVWIYVRCSV